jgi:outer membrane biosynthesis protein TonB
VSLADQVDQLREGVAFFQLADGATPIKRAKAVKATRPSKSKPSRVPRPVKVEHAPDASADDIADTVDDESQPRPAAAKPASNGVTISLTAAGGPDSLDSEFEAA